MWLTGSRKGSKGYFNPVCKHGHVLLESVSSIRCPNKAASASKVFTCRRRQKAWTYRLIPGGMCEAAVRTPVCVNFFQINHNRTDSVFSRASPASPTHSLVLCVRFKHYGASASFLLHSLALSCSHASSRLSPSISATYTWLVLS